MTKERTMEAQLGSAALEMLCKHYQEYVQRKHNQGRKAQDASRWLQRKLDDVRTVPGHLANAIENPELHNRYAQEAAWDLIPYLELMGVEHDGGTEHHLYTILSNAKETWPESSDKQVIYTQEVWKKMGEVCIERYTSHELEHLG